MARRKRNAGRRFGWLSSPDIPFARDDANRFLPWIVAFMVCLTGLMLSVSLSLNTVLYQAGGSFQNAFTVQIPSNGASAKQVVAAIRSHDWVRDAREITREEMQELIEPWLGSGEALDALPLPLLVEVRLRKGAKPDMQGLKRSLRALAPGAEIDDYQLWMEKFSRFSAAVKGTAIVLALLMIITTLAIVVLAAKTALRLHRQTVDVLYTIGARDAYIARQFQRNAVQLVLNGAIPGTLAAVGLFWCSSRLTEALDAPLLPAFDFTQAHVALFVALPLLTAIAALLSTRAAVLSLLKRRI